MTATEERNTRVGAAQSAYKAANDANHANSEELYYAVCERVGAALAAARAASIDHAAIAARATDVENPVFDAIHTPWEPMP
jgi:hypothetical protein